METKRLIICLCGSTKFKSEFEYWNRWFTEQGYIVLMPGVFIHSGDELGNTTYEDLDALHRDKIAMSDIVFIVNKYRYIGKSTRSELEYALSLNKEILYAE